jgi:dethiobiotin synthetase/adenosylmethionine--8-amino-7-oxononanoate aminotransferase
MRAEQSFISGVNSPAPSGELQSKVYRSLHLPTVLAGDSKLGGISTTLSSYETMALRGYEIPLILMFATSQYANHEVIARNVDKSTAVVIVPPPPPKPESSSMGRPAHPMLDFTNMMVYYETIDPIMKSAANYLIKSHEARLERLKYLSEKGEKTVWWPFTQHQLAKKTTVIDSAYGDDFFVYKPNSTTVLEAKSGNTPPSAEKSSDTRGDIVPLFDACASWWTQTVGHGNPDIAMAAAKASGRYGHVMFPECIHEPALSLAEKLVNTVGAGWATRVFYSDNGSTATEVALKMALKKTEMQMKQIAGPEFDHKALEVIGVNDGYHGDTIGSMNACNPNVFNDQVNW